MIEAAQRGLSAPGESDVVAWLAEHGPALLAAARERDEELECQERVAELEKALREIARLEHTKDVGLIGIVAREAIGD